MESPPRSQYLNWMDYFMGVALLSAQRSKDPVTQVGACIINQDKRIVGVGYNGFPNGCEDDQFPWGESANDPYNSKHTYVVHAERNAILNHFSSDLKNCTMFVTRFPCNICAHSIIQSGIKEVYYISEGKAEEIRGAKRMFDAVKIKYQQYEPLSKFVFEIR